MQKLLLLILSSVYISMHGVAQSLPDPGTLRGVHWKTHTIPTFDSGGKLLSALVEANPLNLTDDEKMSLFASWGSNCIALKINDGGQLTANFPGSTGSDDKSIWNKLTTAQQTILINAQTTGTVNFIKAANAWNIQNPNKPVYILLFTRKWFQNGGSAISGNMEEAATTFAAIINKCVTQNCDAPIIGVHAVENRMDAMDSLIPYCLNFGDIINAATNNWLKKKTLFFSGLGMGISFRGYKASNNLAVVGIDQCNGAGTFWTEIQKRCAAFCWVKKNYPKWDMEPTFTKYSNTFGIDPTISYEHALQQQLEQFGQNDLKKFVDAAPNEMYNNVLYWGDASDGLRNTSNNERDALKTVWLFHGYEAATFSHFFNDHASLDTAWSEKNNIAYLNDNKELCQNAAYDLWTKFLDGSETSTYGSTQVLKLPITRIKETSVKVDLGFQMVGRKLIVSTVEKNDCYKLKVVDLQGRIIVNTVMAESAYTLAETIFKGIYFIQLSTSKNEIVGKISI
ncbi:MAG: T9SS type A sorting domain-containing protein [Bacteroidia bacterium]|nr:T9SS type A sorting domain-containing protein [Bacteroidia bacterium]